MQPVLRIFIGFEQRQALAYRVLAHSIVTRATCPTAVCPLIKAQLTVYRRERAPTESTEFSLTRFLVPWLCQHEGWAVYMDCDMVALTDVGDLWREIDRQSEKAVLVCQHDYQPKSATKCLGAVQTTYTRKNWSSFMVFNNARCRVLTPEYVNHAPGLDLHRFHWADDAAIGALPLEWNWLVGEYPPNAAARCLHWTLGGPWLAEYRGVDHADLWNAEYVAMTALAGGVTDNLDAPCGRAVGGIMERGRGSGPRATSSRHSPSRP